MSRRASKYRFKYICHPSLLVRLYVFLGLLVLDNPRRDDAGGFGNTQFIGGLQQ